MYAPHITKQHLIKRKIAQAIKSFHNNKLIFSIIKLYIIQNKAKKYFFFTKHSA